MRAHQQYTYVSHVDCSRCTRRYDPDTVLGLCTCGAPLVVRYDLDRLATALDRQDLDRRPPSMWRYHELLPVSGADRVVTLGEGMTPVLGTPRLGRSIGVPGLLVKDEALIPTGTFKARGAACGISRAAELGVRRIAMPTNGNAGAAWAAYAARAGIRLCVVMPEDSPEINRREATAYGAEVVLVRGLISDAGAAVRELVATDPTWFDASTLKEPYRLEGKKTMGLELAEQLGWQMPDVIVYPTGGGVGLVGIHKAVAELRELGWIDGQTPRLVAAQSTGCAPIVRAYEQGRRTSEPWQDARTVAFGITVPSPLGDALVLDALAESDGTAVAVDDEDIVDMVGRCARLDGLLLCPEGAAALCAVESLRARGWIGEAERVVVLNTGAGTKYPEVLHADPAVIDPGDAVPALA
ncbi:MAG: threonine synthase [Actinomycetes bacterium]